MMCPEVLHGLAEGLKQTNMIPGNDYDIVTFSIDPADSAADAKKEKANFLRTLELPGAAETAHFLTGSPARSHLRINGIPIRPGTWPGRKA
jgi:protein SCO1/2